jgi:nitrate reductase assembly molybdenum cofactor insertion protein NarJ
VNRTPAEDEKDRRIRQLEQLVQERTARLSGALEQLQQSYDDTLEALGSALDLKDEQFQDCPHRPSRRSVKAIDEECTVPR